MLSNSPEDDDVFGESDSDVEASPRMVTLTIVGNSVHPNSIPRVAKDDPDPAATEELLKPKWHDCRCVKTGKDPGACRLCGGEGGKIEWPMLWRYQYASDALEFWFSSLGLKLKKDRSGEVVEEKMDARRLLNIAKRMHAKMAAMSTDMRVSLDPEAIAFRLFLKNLVGLCSEAMRREQFVTWG